MGVNCNLIFGNMTEAVLFSTYSPILHQIAIRLLKCKMDAEDVVHETFVKWLETNQEKVKNTKAYLIRSVTNNCFTYLRNKRESQFKSFPKEGQKGYLSFFTEINFSGFDLDKHLEGAFNLIHSRLEPMERAIFILRAAFDIDYKELSQMVNRNADHCRQLFSRANKKLQPSNIPFKNIPNGSSLLESFKKACQAGNPTEFINELLSSQKEAVSKKR